MTDLAIDECCVCLIGNGLWAGLRAADITGGDAGETIGMAGPPPTSRDIKSSEISGIERVLR